MGWLLNLDVFFFDRHQAHLQSSHAELRRLVLGALLPLGIPQKISSYSSGFQELCDRTQEVAMWYHSESLFCCLSFTPCTSLLCAAVIVFNCEFVALLLLQMSIHFFKFSFLSCRSGLRVCLSSFAKYYSVTKD